MLLPCLLQGACISLGSSTSISLIQLQLLVWARGAQAGDVLRQKQLLRQQIEVPGSTTVDEAITAMVNERVASFMVVDAAGKVIGLFTARDVLGVLARFPNKADGLAARVHEFMIPLSQMITCSPEDSLYQCLLVMTELRIRNLPVLADGQVGGIINSNDISDFTFSSEQLGGKKAYINNIRWAMTLQALQRVYFIFEVYLEVELLPRRSN
ncbi:hypothetical protein JKP88DRAFT_168314 [Tribonema minus]|uniref:CBS domain-containing protein n=1 Tax=Tribonema minus TaxID=303371 RepID=A0A836CC85_9STRA|nr:hypothetical protein JKP88DRAFT_168314 [Tribonema minus]